MFQPAPPAAPEYMPPPAAPGQPKWLTGVAIGVIVVMIGCALYWFFGRPTSTSAVIEAPVAAQPGAAGENPLQKYIEITGLRFGPQSKGVQVTFVLINHSDSDVVGLAGTATIMAKTEKGGEEPIGTVNIQTSMGAQSSKELTLPLNTKLKLMEMPDWQNAKVTVKITSPAGA